MRHRLFFCLMMMGLFTVNAQEFRVIDSLEDLSKTQKGEAKVNTLLALSEEMMAISFDESIAVAELAEKEARKTNDMNLVAKACFAQAEAYYKRYDYDLAETSLREAMRNVAQDDDKTKLKIYKRLASVSLRAGNADTAALYYEKSRYLAQMIGDKLEYADAINNLALIDRNKGNQEEAMKGFEEAVGLYYEVNDSLSAARSLSNVAMLYFAKNQYEDALSILEKLVPFFERTGENKDLARNYSNLGLISLNTIANIDTALVYFGKARHYADLANDSLMMVDIMLNECDLFLMNGQIDNAFANLNEVERISARLSYYEGLTATYVRYAEVYYLIDEFVKSIDYIRLCRETEEKTGVFLYTPLLKPYLMRCYANLGAYDSIAAETQRYEQNYHNLLAEKNELELIAEDLPALEEENENLQYQNTKLRYVVAGLATLLVVLAIYTIVSGRPKKEK